MGKINWGRVVLGGLLAGLVLNVLDFLVNGVWLGTEWNAAMQALGKGRMDAALIKWFVISDFLAPSITTESVTSTIGSLSLGATTPMSASRVDWNKGPSR